MERAGQGTVFVLLRLVQGKSCFVVCFVVLHEANRKRQTYLYSVVYSECVKVTQKVKTSWVCVLLVSQLDQSLFVNLK